MMISLSIKKQTQRIRSLHKQFNRELKFFSTSNESMHDLLNNEFYKTYRRAKNLVLKDPDDLNNAYSALCEAEDLVQEIGEQQLFSRRGWRATKKIYRRIRRKTKLILFITDLCKRTTAPTTAS